MPVVVQPEIALVTLTSRPVDERVTYDDRGQLDEVVTAGGAHLERMSGGDKRGRWFLLMQRADGSEFCVWFEGAVTLTEERPPRPLPDKE